MKSVFGNILIAVFALGTSIFFYPNAAHSNDFEKFYLSGEDEVCGVLPKSCRNPTCGLDASLPRYSATCRGRGTYTQAQCNGIDPSVQIKDEARARGVVLNSVPREVKISSPGGRCEWDSWEESNGNFMDDNGVCCSAVGLGGDCILDGNGPKPCTEEVNFCSIGFSVFASCESSDHCGTRADTCKSIVFGIDEVTILELSPFIENEKLFRNAINSISINHKAGLLDNIQAVERADLAEASFNDVAMLEQIISEEEERRTR